MSRRKRWVHSEGTRPHVVGVYERESGGTIYGRIWDPTRGAKGAYRKASLGHRDRERATRWAKEQHLALMDGRTAEPKQETPTLAHVFAMYREHQTPSKRSATSAQEDDRRVEMFLRAFGRLPADGITTGMWERFGRGRRAGAIDGRGRPVPESRRQKLRTGTVEADLRWLKGVMNWAAEYRTGPETFLLDANPLRRGFKLPKKNYREPPAETLERLTAYLAVARDVTMECRWHGKRTVRPSFLPELIAIAAGTGRRLSAILALRRDDYMPEHGGPDGALRWREEHDKQQRESIVSVNADVKAAVLRRLGDPGVLSDLLFPSPSDPAQPCSRHLADSWLRKAQKEAQLPPLDGTLWHGFRRLWANERKNLPLKDVAAVGGWKDAQTLQKHYERADQETELRVVYGSR